MKGKHGTKLLELQKIKTGVCQKCGHDGAVTVDHIIPIQILEVLGRDNYMALDWAENFQLLCPPCNKLKANRLDITNPKTKVLLQELINQI